MKTPSLCVGVHIRNEELATGHLIYDQTKFSSDRFSGSRRRNDPVRPPDRFPEHVAEALQKVDGPDGHNLRQMRNGPAPFPVPGRPRWKACYDLPVAVAAV